MIKKLLVFLFIVTSLLSFSQTNFYVATNGNDSNDGSLANPWLTIQFGVYQLAPGDVLNIRAGVYEEKIYLEPSGTIEMYITIKNYQDEEVILDASNSNTDIPIIYTDASYQRIEGLWIRNSQINYAGGISLQGAAHHIEIINNKISNINFSSNPDAAVNSNTNSVPLGVLGDSPTDSIHNIIIRGNEVFDNRTGFSENITLGGNVSGFIIEDNIVHDNANIGIDMTGNYGESSIPALDHARNGLVRNNLVYNCYAGYSASAGIYVDGGVNIVVENNVCHHNGYGGEIGCEENGYTDNIIFRNNLFYKNASAGMHIGAYDEETSGVVTNSKILNNTFYQNDTNNWFNGELIISQFENGEIKNNIFYISNQNVLLYSYRAQPNLVFDYNLIYTAGLEEDVETTVGGNQSYTGLVDYYLATGYGDNSHYGDPLFLSPTTINPDFHILENSPAINAGDPIYIVSQNEVDLDGQNRINNAIIDCGVDEFAYGSFHLNVKVFLQGPYQEIAQTMSDYLRIENLIPLNEPFTSLGYIHVVGGGEVILQSVLDIEDDNSIVDWVFIELRDELNPVTVIATQSALLQRDGDIVSVDGVSPVTFESLIGVDSVFIAIRHRNHFGVRTNISYSILNEITIDFTDPIMDVYGTNSLINVFGKMTMISGDANSDGQINPVDKNDFWRIENGQTFNYLNTKADFNMDGSVNPVDKNAYWRFNNSMVEQLD